MGKKLLLFFTLLLCFSALMKLEAKQVTVEQALKVAQTIYQSGKQLRSTPSFDLIHTQKSENSALRNSSLSGNLYYIFNVSDDGGFVIVAADDVVSPIIAYSEQGSYVIENQPENLRWWMKGIANGIEETIKKGQEADSEVSKEWETLLSGSIVNSRNGEEGVKPLLSSEWSQSEPFNKLAPVVENYKTPTGCVATAMAQVMNYYKYPDRGTQPTKEYVTRTRKIPMPSVDITKHYYDWDNMINVYAYNVPYTEVQANAVAQLMYDCGLSVEMDYDLGGSGAFSSDVDDALIKYFGYDESMKYIYRSQYTQEAWMDSIKENLHNKRPVYYSGRTLNSGHAFICDGYRTFNNQTLIHFNWGWGRGNHGYYSIDNTGGYSYSHAILSGIKPAKTSATNLLVMTKDLKIDAYPSSVTVGQEIEVSAILMAKTENYQSTGKFEGQYKIVVTEKNGVIITETEPENISFKGINHIKGKCRVVKEGNHWLKIYYKVNNNGSWQLVGKANSNIINEIELNISGVGQLTNELTMTQALNMTCSNISGYNCVPGEIADVTAGISTSPDENTFRGSYALMLTDKLDKNIILYEKEIVLTGRLPLEFDIVIPEGIPPGDYSAKLMSKAAGQTNWQIIGGNNNLANITVANPLDAELCFMRTGIELGTKDFGPGSSLYIQTAIYSTIKYAGINCNYCIRLTDKNENVVYSSKEKEINLFEMFIISESIRFPEDIPTGEYKLSISVKKEGGEWKDVNYSDGTDGRVDININENEDIALIEDITTNGHNIASVIPGVYNYYILRIGTIPENTLFKGRYKIIAKSIDGENEYILYDSGENLKIVGSYNIWQYLRFPVDAIPGKYVMSVFYAKDDDAEFKMLEGASSEIKNTLDITVFGARKDDNKGSITLFGDWTANDFPLLSLSGTTNIDMTHIDIPNENISLNPDRNPNSLVYVKSTAPHGWTNVVFVSEENSCLAPSIQLVDNYPFYAARDIVIDGLITYKRTCFTDGGWESICVPFDVTSIYDIAGRPVDYKLQSLNNNVGNVVNFADVPDKIVRANTPYIISFDEVEGQKNAEYKFDGSYLPATVDVEKETTDYIFKGTYKEISGAGKYVVNEAGTSFGVGTKDSKISPFRGYIDPVGLPDGAPLRIGREDNPTGMDTLTENDFIVNSVDGHLEIISGKAQDVKVYSIDGRLVSIYSINEGYNKISNLAKGVYLVNSRKVIIK